MREEWYVYYDLTESDTLKYPDKRKVLAYAIKTPNITQYFLRTIDTKLVDPNKFNANELMHGGQEFVKVNEEHYNKYMNIIHQQSRTPLSSLERLI